MNSTESNDLIYSDEAQANRYFYYRQYNDINFFVEDIDKQYQYEEIIDRLLGDEYRICSIFTAGGKEKLKIRFEEFGEFDADNSDNINIYMADGDFDIFLHKDKMVNSNHFIYLRTYNIENYYIDEKAVVRYMVGILRKQRSEVERIVAFDRWLETIIEQAKPLFLYYCYIQKNGLGIENTGRNPAFFIDDKSGFEREGALERFKSEIQLKCSICLNEKLDEIAAIENDYRMVYGNSYFELICGKFLLHSLYCYLLSLLERRNLDKNLLEWDLIRNFDINKLSYVKDRIDALCGKIKH